jgi:hypothetical protein
MRKEPVLGLAGLILTGVLGCEMNRPYCGRCALARNNYGQAETAYRPKTVVTMRAEEVPENPAAVSACPTVQLVNSSATVTQSSGQTAGSTPMVTLTIPAMKITVPMTTMVAAPSATVKETSSVAQQPPTVGGLVQAVGTSTMSSSSPSVKSADADVHSAVQVKKQETPSSVSMTSEAPSLPDPVPESKPKGKSAAGSKDPTRLPRLSLLPTEPPPEITIHRTSVPGRTKDGDVPPPPPPIPKLPPSSGPALPSEDTESK